MSLPSRLKAHAKQRWKRYALLLVLLCGYGVMKAGEWEAGRLECTTTALPAEVLPGCGPLRIAFISDVHDNRELFQQAIAHIEKAKPDLILFGGDLVMAEGRFKRTRRMIEALRQLKETAPCYAILGNHDYEKLEQVQRVFAAAGVPLLRNSAVEWQAPNGTTLRLVGLGDSLEGDEAPENCLHPGGQEDKPVLLLSHDPNSTALLGAYAWNLMLSGHTHGGQLGNPFTGRYISFRSATPAGFYKLEEGGNHLFVTRGVGSILGMRFFCRPEVSILDIGKDAEE